MTDDNQANAALMSAATEQLAVKAARLMWELSVAEAENARLRARVDELESANPDKI